MGDLRMVRRFRNASQAIIDQTLDIMHAQLVLACAAEGDMEQARRHYEIAKPRLVALKNSDDIARCEEALGLAASV